MPLLEAILEGVPLVTVPTCLYNSNYASEEYIGHSKCLDEILSLCLVLHSVEIYKFFRHFKLRRYTTCKFIYLRS
jgi:hypothetical protein